MGHEFDFITQLWMQLPFIVLLFGTLVMPDEGENQILATIFGGASAQAVENLTLKLYQNNITPADSDVAATYTEATFTGYAAATLTRGAGWTLTPGDPSSAAYGQQAFTSSAAQATQQIYGYFVIGAVSGKLYWAERFPAGPYPIANDGDEIRVTPAFTLDGSGA